MNRPHSHQSLARLHLQAGARTVSLEMRLCLYCPHRCGQFPPEPPAGPGGSHRHGLPQSAVQLGLAPDNLSCPKALLEFAEAEMIQLGLFWLQQATLSLFWAPGYLPASLPFWCPQVPCRPLRSGAGPLLGHLHTEKGFSLQKLRRAFLTLTHWYKVSWASLARGDLGIDRFLLPQHQASMHTYPHLLPRKH